MLAMMMAGANIAPADGWDPTSQASNLRSIVNSRHNMTVSYNPVMSGIGAINDYGEVCVYCHTPHGANGTINAPLWNRTEKGNTYTLYNIPLTSGQTPTQPGVSSLTCLSCHDGTVGPESIINMPGPGLYSAAQQTNQDNNFLNTWPGGSGFAGMKLGNSTGDVTTGLTCTGNCHDGTAI